jgi:hypothetical protein
VFWRTLEVRSVLAAERDRRKRSMKKNKKILPFPAPSKEPGAPIVIFTLGDKRVAVRWELEVLPPPAPLLPWKPAKKD